MATHSHPNPANSDARIDRMMGLVDPCGTDQNALRERTSIHHQSATHTAPVRGPGVLLRLQRLHMVPLLAAVLGAVLGLFAAGLALDLPATARTSSVIARGPQALLDMPNDVPSRATDTTDPSIVSAASVWPDSQPRSVDPAEEPSPTF